MEHAALASATAAALDGWLAERPPGAATPRMVDLGCGDLALLSPLLRRLPLGSYTGLDLAAVIPPLAERALGPVPYPTRWQEVDLLTWASASAASPPVEILHSAIAIQSPQRCPESGFPAGRPPPHQPGRDLPVG